MHISVEKAQKLLGEVGCFLAFHCSLLGLTVAPRIAVPRLPTPATPFAGLQQIASGDHAALGRAGLASVQARSAKPMKAVSSSGQQSARRSAVHLEHDAEAGLAAQHAVIS